MIVFCEECGERNIVEPERINPGDPPVRCRACMDVLRFALPQQQAATIPDGDAESPAEEPSPAPPATQLDVRFGNHEITVSQTRPTVTMGRQEHNDLEVIDTRVSRSHARIEYRDGFFMLIDHSTNGTFVQMNGKQGVNLKQNEIPLEGSGIITLGRKVSPTSPKAIHFSMKA